MLPVFKRVALFLFFIAVSIAMTQNSAYARRSRYRFTPTHHKPAPDDFQDKKCLQALRNMKVNFRPLPKNRYKGVATPVEVLGGTLGGVRYRGRNVRRRMIMDCRLALALQMAGPLFSANGITTVIHGDFYRWRRVEGSGRLSRHALGLAVDMYYFVNAKGRKISVVRDYERNLATRKSCEGFASTWQARLLRGLVCDLDYSGLFETVLTPDYDTGHRDHFHVSVFHPLDRKRYRRHRTSLLGSINPAYRWIGTIPHRGDYNRQRVRRVHQQRQRATRAWYRKMQKEEARKKREEHKRRLKKRRGK